MPTLAITVHLERLESVEDANPGSFYFGITLGTALDSGGAPPQWNSDPVNYMPQLAPWRWTNFQPRVFVWKKTDGAGPLTTAFPVPATRVATLLFDGAAGAELEAFAARRASGVPDPSPHPFYLDTDDKIQVGKDYEVKGDLANDPKTFFTWPVFLQNVAAQPPELSHPLQLSHIVRIDRADLVAAGILDPDTEVFAVFAALDATIDTQAHSFNQIPEPLDPGLAFDFHKNDRFPEQNAFKLVADTAQARSIVRPVVINKSTLPGTLPPHDMRNLWTKVTADADGHDPTSQTLQNLMQAIDPAQHLVDLLRRVLDPNQPPLGDAKRNSALLLARKALLLFTRELCQSVALLDEVNIALNKPGLPVIDLQTILRQYERRFSTVTDFEDEWFDVLKQASPQLRELKSALEGQSPQSLLSTAEIVTAQLSNREVRERVITTQWQRAVSNDGLWLKVGPALTSVIQAADTRIRFQRGWMKPCLLSLVPKLGKPEFQSVAAKTLYKQLLDRLSTLAPPVAGGDDLPQALVDLRVQSRKLLRRLAAKAASVATNEADQRRSGTEDAHPVIFTVDAATDLPDHTGSVAGDDDL